MPFLAGAILSLSVIAETQVLWEAWEAVRCCNRLQVFQAGRKTSEGMGTRAIVANSETAPEVSNQTDGLVGSIGTLAGLQHIARTSLLEVGASLCLILFLALPLLNPWVRGDGVVRAPLNSDGTET